MTPCDRTTLAGSVQQIQEGAGTPIFWAAGGGRDLLLKFLSQGLARRVSERQMRDQEGPYAL